MATLRNWKDSHTIILNEKFKKDMSLIDIDDNNVIMEHVFTVMREISAGSHTINGFQLFPLKKLSTVRELINRDFDLSQSQKDSVFSTFVSYTQPIELTTDGKYADE